MNKNAYAIDGMVPFRMTLSDP